MNLEYLNFSFNTIIKRAKFTWQEIDFAYRNSIINREDVVSYAVYILEEDMLGYENVLELAIIEKHEEIDSVLNALLEIEPLQEEKEVKEKWLYILLADLYTKREEYESPLAVVEELYADFDYPSEVISFVRYMPSEEAKKFTKEENLERLMINWKKYLDAYSKLLQN